MFSPLRAPLPLTNNSSPCIGDNYDCVIDDLHNIVRYGIIDDAMKILFKEGGCYNLAYVLANRYHGEVMRICVQESGYDYMIPIHTLTRVSVPSTMMSVYLDVDGTFTLAEIVKRWTTCYVSYQILPMKMEDVELVEDYIKLAESIADQLSPDFSVIDENVSDVKNVA